MKHSTPVKWMISAALLSAVLAADLQAEDRYHSDSDSRYLHHISLYDVNNRKIQPDSTTPYSPMNTCGRCHDYDSIAHGWHFNAFQTESVAGRAGEPWIWTDPKTGTQLPLSYRNEWKTLYRPGEVGITPWEMTLHFGDRVPGGNMGIGQARSQPSEQQASEQQATEQPLAEETAVASDPDAVASDAAVIDPAAGEPDRAPLSPRWPFTGTLEIDCMVCHAVSGAYDFEQRRLHIRQENFAWAPTAALRLGVVQGRASSIKDDADPDDDATQQKIPQVTYDVSRFNPDGSVFMDLVRKPSTNACYQCHSNRTVTADGIEPRWVHDQDVHLRAGMDCVDCHRNGIDHHIVRGFEGEDHPSGVAVETLSCRGCHLGAEEGQDESIALRPGRLGSPRPLHVGLPPLHFEKLSCTACHGGPIPKAEAAGIMTSLSHGLGEKGHRTGEELPRLKAPVYLPGDDGEVGPHRAMWPAFWGELKDGKVTPLAPSQVYDATRRALRVRKDFRDEVLNAKLSSSELKELLGEQRAKLDQEWSNQEQSQVDVAASEKGRQQFNQKVYAALLAIEDELKVDQAVYVSSGFVYGKGTEEDTVNKIEVDDSRATSMIAWPMAHQVRPAGWSLGATGCIECHSEDGKFFSSNVSAIGPGPDQGEPVTMASLQDVDPDQRLQWNEMFQGRKSFKFLVGGSIVILLMTLFVGIGAFAARLGGKAE
ncbi:MAG: hypothetical protein P8L85_08080 [Rubripirellula sp.]|nr:hypothetical protein [Rubripirellula sp.]